MKDYNNGQVGSKSYFDNKIFKYNGDIDSPYFKVIKRGTNKDALELIVQTSLLQFSGGNKGNVQFSKREKLIFSIAEKPVKGNYGAFLKGIVPDYEGIGLKMEIIDASKLPLIITIFINVQKYLNGTGFVSKLYGLFWGSIKLLTNNLDKYISTGLTETDPIFVGMIVEDVGFDGTWELAKDFFGWNVYQPNESKDIEKGRATVNKLYNNLHSAGFGHGDGHLGNIMIKKDGTEAKFIDLSTIMPLQSRNFDPFADDSFNGNGEIVTNLNGWNFDLMPGTQNYEPRNSNNVKIGWHNIFNNPRKPNADTASIYPETWDVVLGDYINKDTPIWWSFARTYQMLHPPSDVKKLRGGDNESHDIAFGINDKLSGRNGMKDREYKVVDAKLHKVKGDDTYIAKTLLHTTVDTKSIRPELIIEDNKVPESEYSYQNIDKFINVPSTFPTAFPSANRQIPPMAVKPIRPKAQDKSSAFPAAFPLANTQIPPMAGSSQQPVKRLSKLAKLANMGHVIQHDEQHDEHNEQHMSDFINPFYSNINVNLPLQTKIQRDSKKSENFEDFAENLPSLISLNSTSNNNLKQEKDEPQLLITP
jgi:hypothetical protein